MVHTTINEGIDTLTYFTGLMAGDRKSSLDNPYIDWFNDMRVIFYEEADYGNDSGWTGAGSGVDVSTTFPGSPSNGVPFLRKNTNGASGQTRLYVYEGTWTYVTVGAGLNDLTDVVITSVGDLELLQYDNASSNWRNRTFAEIAYPFDDIGNPDADVNFTMGVNHLHLTFTAPTTEAGFIVEGLGNIAGRDLVHIHHTTGTVTAAARLLHLQWADADVIPMRWMGDDSSFHLNFDMDTNTTSDKTITFPDTTGTVALTSEILAWLLIADIDDTPIDSELSAPISSNWAYDHQNNPTNIKHLTDAQLAALHAEYTDPDAVNAIEGVSNASIATGDSVIFKDVSDSGNLKRDLVSDLLDLSAGVVGTYVVWLSLFAADTAYTSTAGTTGATYWGGGANTYAFGSGAAATYIYDLSKVIPHDIAGKRVTIDNVRSYFWQSGSVTCYLYKQQINRNGTNDAPTQVSSSSTFTLITGLAYYVNLSGESQESTHAYWLEVTNVPTSASPRLHGVSVQYSVS